MTNSENNGDVNTRKEKQEINDIFWFRAALKLVGVVRAVDPGQFLPMKSSFKSVRGIIFKRSRNNMALILHHLQMKLKRAPEWDLDERDKLTRKIELLKIIRYEMKICMQDLE